MIILTGQQLGAIGFTFDLDPLSLNQNMKSAYELAMERLQKQSPSQKLNEDQKAQIAELDSVYKAKKAERELFLRGEIAKAEAAGDGEAFEQLNKQLTHELRKLDEDLEKKKEKVRKGRSEP